MTATTKFFCPTCNTDRKFHREGINHRLHLILTVLTGGLWLVSWIAITIGRRYEPWNCNICDMPHHPPSANKKKK